MGIFGIFGKVLPWKRKDELALGNNLGLGPLGGFGPGQGMQGMQGPGFGGMPYDQQFGGMGNLGMGGLPPSQYSQPQPLGQFSAAPQAEAFQKNQEYERSYAAGKEIEIVSAKLDAIKAALETLNQRLATIERYIQAEQDFKKRGGW